MSELVASGITLAGGARGVRSLFSSKPSEKEVLRVKRLGTLAFRALGAAIAADGEPSRDERSLLLMLLRSLALPTEEESLLAAAPLGDVTSVEIFGELEPKNAALVLRGAWQAALRDGLDAREEGALAVLASRLQIKPEEAAALRVAVEQSTEARRLLGRAVIDACYWLLGDDVALARGASSAAASLLLPDPERSAILTALAQGAPPRLCQPRPLAPPPPRRRPRGCLARRPALQPHPQPQGRPRRPPRRRRQGPRRRWSQGPLPRRVHRRASPRRAGRRAGPVTTTVDFRLKAEGCCSLLNARKGGSWAASVA